MYPDIDSYDRFMDSIYRNSHEPVKTAPSLIQKLREKTKVNMQRLQQELQAELQRKREEAARQETWEKSQAEIAVERIVSQAHSAADKGQNFVDVGRLDKNDYNWAKATVTPNDLKGVTARTVTKLQSMGFTVDFVADWDGGGMDSWYNMFVKW